METNKEVKHSQKFIRFRKMLLFMPVLVLPFITLAGYALGMIRQETPKEQKVVQGFNSNLPDARPLADSNWNKLRFYEQADEDSARRLSQVKADPYYAAPAKAVPADSARYGTSGFSYDPYPSNQGSRKDPNEERVMKKLAELDKELARQPAIPSSASKDSPGSTVASTDVDRLEKMMSTVTGDNSDPALDQINGLLDKILDVQHPDRIKEKIKDQSLIDKKSVFPVTSGKTLVAITTMGHRQQADSSGPHQRSGNGFYGLDGANIQPAVQQAIRASIASAQTLVNGATVEMMLNDEVYIAGVLVPKYTFIYGTVSLNADRLLINVTSVQYKNQLFPVTLSVYDLDGMEGIFVPGSITRDVSKQSTDQAIQGLGIASLDPSLGAQAATTGIEAAKSLIGKKARLVRVNVGKGYDVLLFDRNVR